MGPPPDMGSQPGWVSLYDPVGHNWEVRVLDEESLHQCIDPLHTWELFPMEGFVLGNRVGVV